MKTKTFFFISLMYLMFQNGIVQGQDKSVHTSNSIGVSAGFGGLTSAYNYSSPGLSITASPLFAGYYDRSVVSLFKDGLGYLSIGGEFAYGQISISDNVVTDKLTYTYIALRAGLNYIIPANNNIIIYGRLSGGIANATLSGADFPNTSASGFRIQTYLGGRYYFSKTIGIFAEFGSGLSYLNVGLNFRF